MTPWTGASERYLSIATLALIGLLLPCAAIAQADLTSEEEKEASAIRKAAARARESDAFFAAKVPFEITLSTNIRRIRSDKEDKAPWRPATFSYTDPAGKLVSIPARIRTRGLWRLKNCEFPPLRLNFTSEETKGTLLQGLDKPKLVNYCRDNAQFEQYIAQEMQLYRILNLLTPASHRARLLKVSYVDSATGRVHARRLGILLEEPEAVAARLGGPIVETEGATPAHLDPSQDALAGVFQYFIGNTDWSTFYLHNAELVRLPSGDHVSIPYDFDFAGAINAEYATVDPKLRIKRVRDRLFRGFCYPPDEFEKAFARFNEQKQSIYGLYRDSVGNTLSKKTVDETLRYFDEFYDTINDSRRARKSVIDACVKAK